MRTHHQGDLRRGTLQQFSASTRSSALVVRHECPQPTTNNWGPPCRAEPAKKSPMRARVFGQGWQGRAGQFGQRRERVCAFRGCGLSRYGRWAGQGTTEGIKGIHTTRRLLALLRQNASPVRAQYTRYVSLVVAGISPGWSVLLHRPLFWARWSALGAKRHYQRLLSPIHQSGQPGLCATVVCVYQHQGRGSYTHSCRSML